MAAKNIYKKHVKVLTEELAKGKNMVIERKGDYVIISEGYTMLKVWIYNYNVYIRPLDPAHFILIEDGEKILWRGSSLEPEKSKELSMFRIFEETKTDKECKLTGFLIDDDISCNGRMLRLCSIGNVVTTFNEKYIKAIREYCGEMRGHSKYSPIKWEDEIGNGCLVLPVRLDNTKQNMIRTLQTLNI